MALNQVRLNAVQIFCEFAVIEQTAAACMGLFTTSQAFVPLWFVTAQSSNYLYSVATTTVVDLLEYRIQSYYCT